jgi:hypothetical protein
MYCPGFLYDRGNADICISPDIPKNKRSDGVFAEYFSRTPFYFGKFCVTIKATSGRTLFCRAILG